MTDATNVTATPDIIDCNLPGLADCALRLKAHGKGLDAIASAAAIEFGVEPATARALVLGAVATRLELLRAGAIEPSEANEERLCVELLAERRAPKRAPAPSVGRYSMRLEPAE